MSDEFPLLRYYNAETAESRNKINDIGWKNNAGVPYPVALQPLSFT